MKLSGETDTATHTLFLQGSFHDHKRFVHPYNKWDMYCIQGFVGGGVSYYDSQILIHSEDFKHSLHPKTPLSFSQYYEFLLNRPYPDKILSSYTNCFSVSHERILAHSLDFYHRAILSVYGENPETGHYLERLFLEIFGSFIKPFIKIDDEGGIFN